MQASEYNKFNELLSNLSTISAALEAAEAEIKMVQLAAAQELLPKHAAAKISLGNIEAEVRKMSDKFYPELFPDEKKRTHATPFGSVQYRKSTTLEFEDEEKVVLKIARKCDEEEAYALRDKRAPMFTAEQLLRTKIEPNIEALEAFPDAVLGMFGVTRVAKDNFKVVPFQMKTDKPAKRKEVV